MTGNTRYDNDAPQSLRRAILKNDRRVSDACTYRDHAHDDTAGGRFARQTPSMTVGTDPAVQYPALPATSPWGSNPVGREMPLGYSVEEAPLVGEAFEIEQSLRELREASDGRGMNIVAKPSPISPSGEQRSDAGNSSDVIEPGSPLPKQHKRRRRHD